MEESDGGVSYLVTARDASGAMVQYHYDGIKQYRVRNGTLFLYDQWHEDEFGVECRLKAVYGLRHFYRMDRV